MPPSTFVPGYARAPAAACLAPHQPAAGSRQPVPPAPRLARRRRLPRAALAPATALVVAAGVLALAPGAGAQSNVRTRILDACVYDLYFEQRSSERVTERCQCAARKAQGTIAPEEIAAYRVGSRLAGTLREKIYAALQGC